jgi:integrase
MLTELKIEKLMVPKERKEIPDGKVQGLYLIVQPSGAKSWALRYRVHGTSRKLTLGAYPDLGIGAARKKAEKARGELAGDKDPAAEKRQARLDAKEKAEAQTLESLIEDWEKLHLKNRRPNYRTAATSTLKRVFAKHLKRAAETLDHAAVTRTLDELAKNGRDQMAAMAARYGSAMYGWAMKRRTLAVNPFGALPVAPIVKRERVLSDDELRAIWKAAEDKESFNSIVRMLILTGQRRDEVAGMCWGELSDDLSTWTIPGSRAKKGNANVVPLSPSAQEILRAAKRIAGTALVFPGRGRKQVSGWSKLKVVLDKDSGAADWRLHDLRRTVATNLERLGVALPVTEAVLNHVSGSKAGLVGIYQRHEYAKEKRAALDAWASRLEAIVTADGEASNVVELAKTKRA